MEDLPHHSALQNASSGSAIKWLVETNKTHHTLPAKRGTYLVGVKQMIVSDHDGTTSFAHVCLSPSVTQSTYLRNNTSVMAVKSYFVKNQVVAKDFSRTMEYYKVDFNHTNWLKVWVVDNDGEPLNVTGTFLLNMYEV
jgi:hypothetical protein